MKQKLILDVDTGGDDAVAILLAGHHPDVELVAVTVTYGNAPLDITLDNTLRVLEAGGLAHIPVYAGARLPIAGKFQVPLPPEQNTKLPLPPASIQRQSNSAFDFLFDYYRGPDGPATTFVAIGPHTNLALLITRALQSDQDLLRRIPRIVTAAGGLGEGNITKWAEFNVAADPDAARLVFNDGGALGILVSMLGLEVLGDARLTNEDVARMRASNAPATRVAAQLIDFLYSKGWRQGEIYDPVAAAAAINPLMLTTRRMHVDVDLEGQTRGRTVATLELLKGSVDVCLAIDRARYAKVLLAGLP